MFWALQSVKPREFRPPLAKMSIVGSNNRLATPLSQKSGRIVKGPKNPTLPPICQKVRADQLTRGFSAQGRRRIGKPSRFHIIGVTRELHRIRQANKRAKGQAMMRSASGRSLSLNGRIVISIAVICPIFRRRGSERPARKVVEIREVAETRVKSDVQHRLGCGSQSQRRFAQPSQNELMRRDADDLLEGS